MSVSVLFSLKSMMSLTMLSVAIGIGSFLYLTLDPDFEVEPRKNLRSFDSSQLKSKVANDDINQILNTAQQAWSIIDKNRAIVNIKTTHGNALPSRVNDPFDLQSWASPPASHSYTINVYNRLRQRVLQFTYSLQFTYGGTLDGKGVYLDRVTIIPARISVAWGFVFNANVQIANIHNVGTRDEPIAAAHVELQYRLEGLNTVERTETFHVRGDGKYTYLNE